MTVSRILVGVDGSEPAENALLWATELAAQLDAEILVVHATGLLSAIHGELEPEIAVADELASLVAGAWSAAARELGVVTGTTLEAGPPSMALLRVAAREGVDLIVVGSRGIGGAGGTTLGSTSLQLARDTDRPLAVIRA